MDEMDANEQGQRAGQHHACQHPEHPAIAQSGDKQPA